MLGVLAASNARLTWPSQGNLKAEARFTHGFQQLKMGKWEQIAPGTSGYRYITAPL